MAPALPPHPVPTWRQRPTLAERKEITRRIEEARARPSAPAEPPGPTGVHCWVLDAGGHRTPALLLEWQQQRGRWLGLTAFASERNGDRHGLSERWVDAAELRLPSP